MVREVNRQLLLFAARAVARIRPLRDPRVLVPALLHAAIHAVPFTLRVALAAVPAVGVSGPGVASAARAARGHVRLLRLAQVRRGPLVIALGLHLGPDVLRAGLAAGYRALAGGAMLAGTPASAARQIAASVRIA